MTDYLDLVRRSEMIRRDEERQAELVADRAYAVLATSDRSVGLTNSKAARIDEVTSSLAAADALQAAYDIAAAHHFDRRAALARHFGQHWTGPGDPYATHATRWLAENVTADPVVENVVEIVRSPTGAMAPPANRFDDPPRGTFTGSPAEFMAAKRAAVGNPPWPAWMKQEGGDA